MSRARRLPHLAVAVALTAAACGDSTQESTSRSLPSKTADPGVETGASDSPTPVIDPGDGGNYAVDIDPTAFSSVVDNPYLPKLPGARWVYKATGADSELEIVTIEVLDERRMVMGVEAIVVHDVVEAEDGTLIEDTYDWFAQDDEGNVWYFGEDTTAYPDGEATSAGSWEAGVDGALPGIVMPASPEPTDLGYRQEFLAGEAEDMGQVIGALASVTVPAGTFEDVIITRDWTPLEPETVEEKSYARGIGFVLETKPLGPDAGEVVELIEFLPSG